MGFEARRAIGGWFVLAFLMVNGHLSRGGDAPAPAGSPPSAPASAGSPIPTPAPAPSPSLRSQTPGYGKGYAVSLHRFEPTGLALSRPYERGKIPVVMVHGLWSVSRSWAAMVDALEADPAITSRYQFWTFGYSTGEPIFFSAYLLKQAIRHARAMFDPEGKDAAFERMVLVGHSMGGVLSHVMAQESGLDHWKAVSDRSIDELMGPPDVIEVLRNALIYQPLPEVRRIVFIATPHRGSKLDQGVFHSVGTRLIRHRDLLQKAFVEVLTHNPPDFFKEPFRKRLVTSVDQLDWEDPRLMRIMARGFVPRVGYYSILADRRDPPQRDGTDGVVPYASSHLDGAISEHIVHGSHLCQDHPLVIKEVRRILGEE